MIWNLLVWFLGLIFWGNDLGPGGTRASICLSEVGKHKGTIWMLEILHIECKDKGASKNPSPVLKMKLHSAGRQSLFWGGIFWIPQFPLKTHRGECFPFLTRDEIAWVLAYCFALLHWVVNKYPAPETGGREREQGEVRSRHWGRSASGLESLREEMC